jgi:hypothetical protein
VYTLEQQKIDKGVIDLTIASLSARIIGEKQDYLEGYVADYIRIARLWVNKPHLNHAMQVETAKMFQEIAYAPRISAWQAKAYENLLRLTRRMIGASIFRRKGKKTVSCFNPEVHGKGCVCLHLSAYREAHQNEELC